MAARNGGDEEEESNLLVLTERGRGEAGEEEEGPDDEEGSDGSDDDDEEDEEEEDQVGHDGREEEEDEDEDDGGKPEDEEDSDDEDEEEVHDDDDDEAKVESSLLARENIKKELSAMSFEDVLQLRRHVGTKAYNRVAHGARQPAAAERKRLNKNRPAEVSAKKRAPFLRQVVAVKKTPLRDPRFDDLSGEYKAEIFDKTYDFIHDIRRRETQVIQKQLKKTKSSVKKEQLNFLLKKMANQERARQSREQRRASELQHKREQRERANRGARPFFVNKSEQKKQDLAARFSALKTSGKLDAFLGKKRKRNAGKDRRRLPWQQQQQHAR
ncbi:ribosomal RNA processing protein 36 homolog [Vanacampus margaritifer]